MTADPNGANRCLKQKKLLNTKKPNPATATNIAA